MRIVFRAPQPESVDSRAQLRAKCRPLGGCALHAAAAAAASKATSPMYPSRPHRNTCDNLIIGSVVSNLATDYRMIEFQLKANDYGTTLRKFAYPNVSSDWNQSPDGGREGVWGWCSAQRISILMIAGGNHTIFSLGGSKSG